MSTTPAPALPQPLAACPTCGQGEIRAMAKGWGCSRFKEGCTFVVWSDLAGRTITEDIVRELLTKGMTDQVLEGFVSKEQKPFSAKLRLDPLQGHKVVFHFEEQPPLGKCPACGQGDVVARPRSWSCSRYKDGCTFAVWREIAHHPISEDVARELVANGITTEPVPAFNTKLRLDPAQSFKVVLDV